MKNNHLSNDQSIFLFDYPISYPSYVHHSRTIFPDSSSRIELNTTN